MMVSTVKKTPANCKYEWISSLMMHFPPYAMKSSHVSEQKRNHMLRHTTHACYHKGAIRTVKIASAQRRKTYNKGNRNQRKADVEDLPVNIPARRQHQAEFHDISNTGLNTIDNFSAWIQVMRHDAVSDHESSWMDSHHAPDAHAMGRGSNTADSRLCQAGCSSYVPLIWWW